MFVKQLGYFKLVIYLHICRIFSQIVMCI